MKYPFFKLENNQFIFTGEKMNVYIPKEYFDPDKNMATFYGNKIETIGMIFFRIFKSEDDTNGGSLFQLKLPQNIFINYSDIKLGKGKLAKSLDEDEYYILTINKNMVFIDSVVTICSGNNIANTANLFNTAKVPQNINYGELLDIYLSSTELNKTDYREQNVILEACISAICRNKDNLDEPFRMLLAKNPNTSELNYKMISIKDLAMLSSTFSALSSEDINRAILSSVNKARTNGLEDESPIEKTIKY